MVGGGVMRVMAVAAVAIGVLLAPIPALGQTSPDEFEASLRVLPISGAKEKPKPVRLKGRFALKGESDDGCTTTVTGWRLLLPRGFTFNGGKHPSCGIGHLQWYKPMDGCARRTIVGESPVNGIQDPDGRVEPGFTF